MTTRGPGARWPAALALAVFVAMAAAVGWAQDPRAVGAQNAAREWLAIADNLDAAGSWNSAGKKFQGAMPADEWSVALRQARTPLGAVIQRTMLTTSFDKVLPNGAPEGEYALIVYRTAYVNRVDTRETVTLEREADDTWRVIGYFIR
jgi:hypothetical protein